MASSVSNRQLKYAERRERVKALLAGLGLSFPHGRISPERRDTELALSCRGPHDGGLAYARSQLFARCPSVKKLAEYCLNGKEERNLPEIAAEYKMFAAAEQDAAKAAKAKRAREVRAEREGAILSSKNVQTLLSFTPPTTWKPSVAAGFETVKAFVSANPSMLGENECPGTRFCSAGVDWRGEPVGSEWYRTGDAAVGHFWDWMRGGKEELDTFGCRLSARVKQTA